MEEGGREREGDGGGGKVRAMVKRRNWMGLERGSENCKKNKALRANEQKR